jgi:hypothetical protein
MAQQRRREAKPATGRKVQANPAQGRRKPTGPTAEVTDAICRYIEAGNWFEVSCRLAGVSHNTGNKWYTQGLGNYSDRKATPATVEFARRVQEAEDRREASLAMRVRQAAQGGLQKSRRTVRRTPDGKETITEGTETTLPDWHADAWMLERLYPERWGKNRLELTGANGGPVEVAITDGLDDEKRAAALAALLDRVRARTDGPATGGPGPVEPAGGPPA